MVGCWDWVSPSVSLLCWWWWCSCAEQKQLQTLISSKRLRKTVKLCLAWPDLEPVLALVLQARLGGDDE